MNMECNNIREELSAYIDNELSAMERQSVDEHLKTCSKCSLELEELHGTAALLQGVEEVEPPPWLSHRVMAGVREEAGERKRVFRKMYFPFQVKVPVSIFAMLAVAVTAYFLFRTIDPEMRTALTRSQQQTASVEDKGESTGRPALKEELETPAESAAPLLQDPSGMKTDKIGRRTASSAAVFEGTVQTINMAVHVEDIKSARKEIEKSVRDLGGKITDEESLQDKDVLSVTIGSDMLKHLEEKLRDAGEVREPFDTDGLEGPVNMKLEIIKDASDLKQVGR